MKKKLQIFSVLVLLSLFANSYCFSQPQKYWNEWINFSQSYFKIPITKNGIYRIDSLTLAHAGITAVDPRNFQLFFRGQEQYIYVKGEADGVFNSSDYLEFYGQKNDGSLDSVLYKGYLYNQTVRQPNPYYSLFSDTSAYFLTWNNLTSNKRIIDYPDTVYSLPSTDYFMRQDVIENHTEYQFGKFTSTNINFPDYEETEGWSGAAFDMGGSYTASYNTPNLFPAGNVMVKLAVMAESNDLFVHPNHEVKIKYKIPSGNAIQVDDTLFDGYTLFDPSYSIPAANIAGAASTDIIVSSMAGSYSTNRISVPYVVFKYPHNLDLEGTNYYEMYVPFDPVQPKSFFSFTNFNGSSPTCIYDLTEHRRIPVKKTGGVFKALVANATFSNAEKFCVVKTENQFLQVPSIKPVRGNGTFIDYSTLAVDSAYIIITNKKLRGTMTGADAYANYRSSVAGGSHKVLVADIDDLYDEFAYGIPKHPFAIRHFANFCVDKFPSLPQNLFLIGKSVQINLTRNSSAASDPTGVNYSDCMVPSMGFPTSDNMMIAVLNSNGFKPAIPMGRLAAKNIGEVNTYLQKVNDYEHPPVPNPNEWMKHIIHLAGGHLASETTQFAGYLSNYESIIRDTCFGGYVHTFKKTSSSPTQTSFTDSIAGLINSGVSMISFFGHSSANVFDFNLNPPSYYSNSNGKYPFFGAYGCSSGDIHQPVSFGPSANEEYVLSPKGMIGFLASSGPGTADDLNQFAKNFYFGVDHFYYGKPVGKSIQYSIDVIQPTGTTPDPYRSATCLEMTLHGDPAIVIHSNKLPDYAINPTSLYFKPTYISTDLDSFKANVVVTNIGKANHDSVRVKIIRKFSDGTSASYTKTVANLYFKDTLIFTLPVDPNHGTGLNKFEIHVLHTNSELSYLNNDISPPNEIPLMVYSGDIIPVYPYKYAIVPHDTLTLKAYTADPFSGAHRYKFEIDTTDRFNSGWKKTQYVTQAKGAVVKAPANFWSPSLSLVDSTVYFWRVRRDTSDLQNFKWRESSFQYISGRRGWGQSHFFQFLKGDRFGYLDTIRSSRSVDFQKQNHSLEVKTSNYCRGGSGLVTFYIDLNTNVYSGTNYNTCAFPYVIICVIDPITGLPWNSIGGAGGMGYEIATGTPGDQDSLRRFIENDIPAGSKVILFTPRNHNLGDLVGASASLPNPGLVHAFQSIGGGQFTNLRNNRPYILIGRKNGAGVEMIASADSSTIDLIDTFNLRRSSGTIFSETVGPASKWNSFHWKYRSLESSATSKDSVTISIAGINNSGIPVVLKTINTHDSLDLSLSSINASNYATLQLTAMLMDSIKRTPPQLKYWRVYYDGVPDAALNPVKHYSFYNPTVQQGDSIKMSVAIENIGDYNMDSLWMDFWVYDSNRNKVPVRSIKMDSLRINKILVPSIKFSTNNTPGGLNSLWVEANPFNSQHQQLEQYHFNNLGTIPFLVNVDKINPVLDVTFDGVHIMNGDIVSAKPSILIKLKDENTFLALNDQAAFKVFLKKPGKTIFDTIPFGGNMSFESAVLPNNSCKINFSPVLLQDGTYQLKVQAKDRSGNASGFSEYIISFEVINKPSVTNVVNYPNPFSTSTRFVFTLTGSEVPDYFKIQIMTVSGKIIREINKFELGHLHIGRNITDYAWDGKDEFGDQLANGLYLYRVQTQLNGKSLEHRDTGADSFFTQGFGKMYLIR